VWKPPSAAIDSSAVRLPHGALAISAHLWRAAARRAAIHYYHAEAKPRTERHLRSPTDRHHLQRTDRHTELALLVTIRVSPVLLALL